MILGVLFFATTVVVFLVISCKGETPPAPILLSIEASPDRLHVEAGSLRQVKITAAYRESGKKVIDSANFTSANSTVVSVDTLGWFKAGLAGSTNVSVSYKEGEVTKTTVVPVTVTGVVPHNPNAGIYVSE